MPRNIDIGSGGVHYEDFSVEPSDIYQTDDEVAVGPFFFPSGGFVNGFVRVVPPRHYQGYGGLGGFFGVDGGDLGTRDCHAQFLLRFGRDIARHGVGNKLVIMAGGTGGARPMLLSQRGSVADAAAVAGVVPYYRYRPCSNTICTPPSGAEYRIGDPADGAGHADLRSEEWVLFQVGGYGSSNGVDLDGHVDLWLDTEDGAFQGLYASHQAGADTLLVPHTSMSLVCGYWGNHSDFPEISSVDTVNNTITLGVLPPGMNLDLYPDGTDIRFYNRDYSTGSLPGGLLANQTYYMFDRNVATHTFRVATSYADAIAGINPVDLTSSGVGTNHISRPPNTADTYIDICELRIAENFITTVPYGWGGSTPPPPPPPGSVNLWRLRGGTRFL